MNKDRTEKRKSPEPEGHDAQPSGTRDALRKGASESERKPNPAERGEWRGSGVCGDRQTD